MDSKQMNSISELNFDLKKQKILRIRAQNENIEEKRRKDDIDVLCRLLNDDNNNNNETTVGDELSDFSTIESSRESSDCRQSGSSESLNALTLEESLLAAEIKELNERPETEEDDEDLKEFTRIEREIRIAELIKCLEIIRNQIKDKNQRSAPLAQSESLCSNEREDEESPQRRPLTLYMPIIEEMDLRQHVITLGHEVDALESLGLVFTRFSCFGYLNKKCRNSNWRKRFFLFDRNNKQFVYFRTKRQFIGREEPKKGVNFDEIQDVYVNHSMIKQNEGKQVFVVSSTEKQFILSTNRAEVMRGWVDAIVTGAQGFNQNLF